MDLYLKKLTDDQLIDEAKFAVDTERSATTKVIRHFQEIYDRELYLKRGYANMFLMLTKEFKLCNGSAQLRINAMKLIRDVPEVKTKIESGEMSLSVAASVQSFLRAELKLKRPYSKTDKMELVQTFTGLSLLDAQKEFVKRNPEMEKRESITYTSETRVRVSHSQSVQTEEKIQRIKQIWSHIDPNMSRGQIIDRMAEITLDQIDPIRKAKRAERRKNKKNALISTTQTQTVKTKSKEMNKVMNQGLLVAPTSFFDSAIIEENAMKSVHVHEVKPNSKSESELNPNPNRYVPAKDRYDVVLKNNDEGCAFIDEKTGRRCGSKHLLQNDHIIPWSYGGSNSAENLRPYCARHNRWRWRTRLGS